MDTENLEMNEALENVKGLDIGEDADEVTELSSDSENIEDVTELSEVSEEAQEAMSDSLENINLETLNESIDENTWQDETSLTDESLSGAIEALIFMSDRPISVLKIKEAIHTGIPLKLIHEKITELQDSYESQSHGMRLVEIADGFQFRTKPQFARYIQNIFKVSSLALSPTALEVLAMVAYKQPVSRVEIEKMRGVESSHVLRALMDKRLVKVSGRSDEPGRPVTYCTTNEFLEVFNIKELSDLPPEYELEKMLDKNTLGEISDIKTIVTKGETSRFVFDEIDELDELKDKIHNIQADTDFIKTLKKEEKQTEKRSAFDLLEDFVLKSQIEEENKRSVESEILTTTADVKVVTKDELSQTQKLAEEIEKPETPEVIEEEAEDLFAVNNEMTEDELSDALDLAFEKLTGDKLQDTEEKFKELDDFEELDKAQEQLELSNQNLENNTEDAASKDAENLS